MNTKLLEFWRREETQIFIDGFRILLMIFAIILIYLFIKEIEVVKLLGSDVCKLCMEKTGCDCICI